MRIWAIVTLLAITGGCMGPGSNLPNRKYRVGGGFDVNYRAPAAGTVIWADEATGRVWATKSLDAGQNFTASLTPNDATQQQVLGNLTKARPVLFFVPESTATPVTSTR